MWIAPGRRLSKAMPTTERCVTDFAALVAEREAVPLASRLTALGRVRSLTEHEDRERVSLLEPVLLVVLVLQDCGD